MPQPADVRSYSRPNQAVLQRPALAALIGAIAAEWTQVEAGLVALIAGAFGATSTHTDGGYSINNNWVAHAAIAKSETIRVRLKILDATFGELVRGTSVEAAWIQLRADLEGRSKERNKIVHGIWVLAEDFPDDVLLAEEGGRLLRYTEADFKDVLARISKVSGDCHNVLLKTLDAVHNKEIPERFDGPKVL